MLVVVYTVSTTQIYERTIRLFEIKTRWILALFSSFGQSVQRLENTKTNHQFTRKIAGLDDQTKIDYINRSNAAITTFIWRLLQGYKTLLVIVTNITRKTQ